MGCRLCCSVASMEMPGVAKCTDFVFQQLKDDAVALVDVIAPPDSILNSPIGRADGEVKSRASSRGGWGRCTQDREPGALWGLMAVVAEPEMMPWPGSLWSHVGSREGVAGRREGGHGRVSRPPACPPLRKGTALPPSWAVMPRSARACATLGALQLSGSFHALLGASPPPGLLTVSRH